MQQITLIIFGFVAQAVLDYIWIGLVAHSFYGKEIGNLARIRDGVFRPDLLSGAAVYLLMAFGLTLFVLPKVGPGQWGYAALFGALWGLILGGVYDLTNYSVLGNWSARLAFADMAWITATGAAVTLLLVFIRDTFFA